jgi:uncharacterized iron-regulated protein
LIGCAGKYGGDAPTTPAEGKRGIEAAGLPYSVLDARTGHQVDPATFWAAVDASQVVCVGEDHPNPHHHWFQLEVVKHVAAHRPLALGMEMFQRPFQGVLDDYAAHRIDQDALLSRSGYADRWGYDFGFYAPTIDAAVAAGATLLALNMPKELTKKVVHHGLESLTPDEKRQVPDLVLDDAAHRAWFDETMENMGGAQAHTKQSNGADDKGEEAPAAEGEQPAMPSGDRIYTAQVMWDESMADGAAQWVKRTPQGLLVLLAGNGHCHDTAIVNRIKRRGVDKVISLHPVLDTDDRVAEALAKPMNDYVIVLELPADVKAKMAEQ